MGLHQLGEGGQDGEGTGGAGEKAKNGGKLTTWTLSTRAKGKERTMASVTLAVAMATTCMSARRPRHLVHRSAMDAMAKGITKPSVRRPTLNSKEKAKDREAQMAEDGAQKVMEEKDTAGTKEDTKEEKDMAGKDTADMAAKAKERITCMR